MHALILETPGRLVAADIEAPSTPGAGEAIVRIHRVGVCGTDQHAFAGQQPFFTFPRILGHELGVEVVATGSGVTHVRPGDRCAVEPYLNCGSCIACRRGTPNCCTQLRVLGVHEDGGMREEMLVPADKLHPSSRLSFDQLALVEPLGIGAHAVQRARLQRGETVAVLGAGPIGLAVIQFAKAAGARVLVVDVNSARLDFCRGLLGIPGDQLIDARTNPTGRALLDLTGGDGPTAVFEATGNAASMMAAFEYPAHGGRLVFVGLVRRELNFDDPNFHRRELTLLASRNALPADFRQIIDLIEQNRVNTTPWITHRATLLATPEKFAAWRDPASGVVKAMIDVAS